MHTSRTINQITISDIHKSAMTKFKVEPLQGMLSMKHKLQHRHNTYKDIVNVQNIGQHMDTIAYIIHTKNKKQIC